MAVLTRTKRLGRRFLREESGTATIEFVLLFPAIMWLFFSAIEVGVHMTRMVMLDRALDLNVRALRLGALDPATHDELKRRVCSDALIFKDCPNAVIIELIPISRDNWSLPSGGATCVDRSEEIDPAIEFTIGGENQIMLVRACAVLNPFFGASKLVMQMPLDDSGGVVITAASTFVNEP
ncbi:TadE/TadG family type IV pilus assembly protein [Aliiroseovarius sp.]|uniref:TadE/TadG family type IV pilus assembly protein n=1 Tax=Aliiroseovarius sp. TaxID=1872442 RepID=UPI003BA871FD